MRSNELAKTAGVSVRTLRHYHAIGLLPEPPRGENGYRNYGPEDLVRLLRVKRLSSLGFSLSRIGDVLDEMDASLADSDGTHATDALDELDRELAAHIERLQEQRRTITLLKQEQLDVDLPVRFARIKKLFEGLSASASITKGDREALLVAGNLFTEEDADELERVVTALFDDDMIEQLQTVQARFDELPPNAARCEIENAVDAAMELLGPFIDCFDSENWDDDYDDAESLMREIAQKDLNEAQRIATDLLEEALKARIFERMPSSPSKNPE